MTQPMTEVEYTELIARAGEIAAPLGAFYASDAGAGRVGPVRKDLPKPPPHRWPGLGTKRAPTEEEVKEPCDFPWIAQPMYMLATNAQDLMDHLSYGVQQWQHLADSLRNAAMIYQKTDENAADAITTGGVQEPAPAPASTDGRPGKKLVGGQRRPDNLDTTNKAVKDACGHLRRFADTDHQKNGDLETKSLSRFADEWQKYQQILLDARHRFRPFQSWSGDTHDMVEKELLQHIAWCETMAANCVSLANQARTIIKAHKDAVRDHPTNGAETTAHANDNHAPDTGQETDLATLMVRYIRYYCSNPYETGWFEKNHCGSEGWHKDSGCHFAGGEDCDYVDKPDDLNGYRNFEKRFKKLQDDSDRAQENYKNAVWGLSPISSPTPPQATPIPRPAPPKPPDPNPVNPVNPVNPINPVKPTPNMPFMPQMPQVPQMPQMPTEPDEAAAAGAGRLTGAGVKPASLGGGVKPASFGGAGGGGGPSMPLTPMDAEAAAARAAAGAGPGAASAGRGGAGGMGGMPMGGMPMAPGAGGKGDNEGKGKRVQAEDDALYVEDRSWTEGVIGRRRAKDPEKG